MSQSIHVEIEQQGTSSSKGNVRQHTVAIDRPESKGGEDKGPMGGELLLMSLGGCYMSNLLAAIEARDADVNSIHIDVNGTLSGTPTRFSEIRMEISAKYKERSLIEKLVIIAERSCIVANTLKHSVDITFAIH